MKYTIIALPALLLMAALPSSKTTRMDNKDAGWVSLFDGKAVHEFVHDGRHLLGFPCH